MHVRMPYVLIKELTYLYQRILILYYVTVFVEYRDFVKFYVYVKIFAKFSRKQNAISRSSFYITI